MRVCWGYTRCQCHSSLASRTCRVQVKELELELELGLGLGLGLVQMVVMVVVAMGTVVTLVMQMTQLAKCGYRLCDDARI